MLRAYIILSCLTLSVLFRAIQPFKGTAGFILTTRTIDKQSWVYYTMEHIIALGVASCLVIRDNTPMFLFRVFVGILILDFLHYILLFRDEGIGFNLFKVIVFSLAILWTHLKQSGKI